MMLWLLMMPVASAADAVELSYEEALAQGLSRNIALRRAGLDVESADGAMLAAKAPFDPNLNGGAGLNRSLSQGFSQGIDFGIEDETRSWNVGMTQFLPTGTTVDARWNWTRSNTSFEPLDEDLSAFFEAQERTFYRPNLNLSLSQEILQGHRMANNLAGLRRARRARDAAEARLLVQRQQTLEDVATAYWAVIHQGALVEIANQSLDAAKEERRVADAKIAEGTLPPSEKARVDAAVVQAESALTDADVALAAAQDALAAATGFDIGQPLVLTTRPVETTVDRVDADAAVKAALENNPELQALLLMEDGAEEDVSDAKHALLPQLTGTAGFGLTSQEEEPDAALDELFGGDLRNWNIGANLSIPLINRADRGNLATQRTSAAQARLDRLAWERALTQQVRAQVQRIESTAKQIELQQANLRFAEQTLGSQRALRDAGRAIEKDVLDALNAVDNARVALLRSRADHQLAIIGLERLKGTL